MPEVLSSRYAYNGRLIRLRIDTVRLDDGTQVEREIVEHRGAVAVVAITRQRHVLLVRQYRPAVGETLLEVPAGTLEPGEAISECALRELREETGWEAAHLEPLFTQYLAPGYSSEALHVFLGLDLSPSTKGGDADEQIEVTSVPLRDVGSLILSGGIKDAKSIAALLAAEQYIARIERERDPALERWYETGRLP